MTIATLAAVAMLLAVYGMVGARQLVGILQLYQVQSVLLAVAAASLAWRLADHHLWLTAAFTLVLKAAFIPWLLRRLVHDEVHLKREVVYHLGVPGTYVLADGLACFGLFMGRNLGAQAALAVTVQVGVAGFLLGLFLAAWRREALPQVMGLLAAENGLLLATMGLYPGMALITEAGVFLDVVVVALVLSLLVRRMHDLLTHTDTALLKELRG